tara:strand:- start:5536 stop:7350 length:1815 start_codon:yes stop_codon:yes gene_type:complete
MGRFDQAEATCLSLQVNEGNDPDILTLLGTVIIERGDPERAIQYFAEVVKLLPDHARPHNNLGIACRRAGRLEEAEAAYRCALTIDASYAQAHNNLGVVLIERGNEIGAVRSFEAAINFDETFLEARRNLARALLDSNQIERATAEFQRMLETAPGDIGANLSLAVLERQKRSFKQAQSHLKVILNLEPQHIDAMYQQALILEDQGRISEALTMLERIIGLNSNHANVYNSAGILSQTVGDIEVAIKYFRRAISVQSEFAEAHRNLAFARRHVERDDDVRRSETLMEQELDDLSAMHMSFALAKINDDLGEYDNAFEHISRGNNLKRRMLDYDIRLERDFFAELQRTFESSFFQGRSDWGLADQTPIFVVGMPRSGTTLVEQIIASHSRVEGAGEILDLDHLLWDSVNDKHQTGWSKSMQALSRSQVNGLAATYLEGLKQRFPSADHITDKTPGNFHYIGMIRTMLPNAKVINCTRDPVDTCFSCYQNYFTQGVPFSYTLEELGDYYRLYSGLMEHWRRELPEFIYDCSYESLLNDQGVETRRLLEFCNLEWDPACLAFHKTERPVQTASVVQVRQPIYRSSIGRAAHYEMHLAPLREALGGIE